MINLAREASRSGVPQNPDPRADFRDYATDLSIFADPDDCTKLALMIYKAGQVWIDSGTSHLFLRFTETSDFCLES